MIPIQAKNKIVIFSAFYDPFMSGAEQMVKEILERLGGRHDLVLITARLDKTLPRFEQRKNFRIVRVGSGRKLVDKFLYPFLAPLESKRYKPDIIHAIMESYAGGALVLSKYLLPRARRILTLQSGDLDHGSKQDKFIIKFFWKLIHTSPDQVTAISNFLALRAKRLGVPDSRLSVIPNGVDLKEVPPAGERKPKSVVCVARLSWEKGLDYLIKAWPKVIESVPDAKLELIGEGDKRSEIEQLIKQYNLAESVSLKGNLPHNQVLQELTKSEIFICPSLAEGLGIVFIEAQASGCAVIGTKVGGIPDVIWDNENGLLIEPENSDAISSALIKFLTDDGLRNRLATAAAESAKKYDWQSIIEQVDKLYAPRILLCTGIYPPDLGGPATFVQKLARGLKQTEYQADVLTMVKDQGAQATARLPYYSKDADGISIYGIGSVWPMIRRYFEFARLISRHYRKNDIVYCFDITSAGLPAAAIKLFNPRMKLIFRLGGDAQWEKAVDISAFSGTMTEYYKKKKFSLKESTYYLLTQFVLSRADKVIFNAYYLQDIYIKYRNLEPAKCVVIKNIGAIEAEVRPIPISGQSGKTIIYAGRLIGFKNILNLVKAIKIIADRGIFSEGISLKIFGEGTKTEEIKQYIADHKLDGIVSVNDKLTRLELKSEIAMSDLIANVSLSEVNSNFVDEALSIGRKVLLPPESEQNFTQVENPLITYADPLDPEDIAAKAVTALRSDIPAVYGNNSVSSSSLEQVVGQHQAVFSQLLTGIGQAEKANRKSWGKKLKNYIRIFYWFVWYDLKSGNLRPIVHLAKSLIKHYRLKTPYAVIIETGNTCNFHCPTCPTPHSVIHDKRPMEIMSYDKFCRIIDNVKNYVHIAYLYNSNEPLLNPHIVEMIKYAAKSGLHTMISTNASVLDETKSRAILASGLGEIRFAFDGLTKESFEAFREGGNFEMVKKNIETFCRLKREMNVSKPIITLQFILNKLNEDQVEAIKEFCAINKIDRLYVKPFILSGYAYKPEQIKELSDKFFVDKLVDDENVVYEKKDGLFQPKSVCTTCPDVDKVFTVLSDGCAVMCCFDLLGDYVYGEMDKTDLNDLWFSERATLIRSKARQRIFPLCKVCGNVE